MVQVDLSEQGSSSPAGTADPSCITFQFSYAAGLNNGTSVLPCPVTSCPKFQPDRFQVDDGQIPELIFCCGTYPDLKTTAK